MPRVFIRRRYFILPKINNPVDASYSELRVDAWHTCDQSRVGNLNLDDVLLFFSSDSIKIRHWHVISPVPFWRASEGTGPHLLPVTTASSLALRAINHFAGHKQLKASGLFNYGNAPLNRQIESAFPLLSTVLFLIF